MSFLEKSVPLASLFTILVSTLILSILRDRALTGSFPVWVQSHRDVVAVILQIASSLLGILQVLVICSLINFATRIRLFRAPTTLDSLTFWSALSTPRLDTAQPLRQVIALVFLLLLGPLFGAVWSGSLTPISTVVYKSGGSITLPSPVRTRGPMFSIEDNGQIAINCIRPTLNSTSEQNPEILDMSGCPALSLSAALIASARTATSDATPQLHTKISNPDWTYYGRSYGVGASQGLFGLTEVPAENYTGYWYLESGYNTNISCINASTSLFAWKRTHVSGTTPLEIRWADTLTLPSGNIKIPPYEVTTASLTTANQSFFAMAANATLNGSILATSAYSTWYQDFDTMLCTFEWQPTLFNVSVNLSNRTMTVTPLRNATTFDPVGTLAKVVTADVDLLSRINSNLVVSTIGTALADSRRNLNVSQPGLPRARLTTLTLEVFITSLVDDFLVARGTEQLILYKKTVATNATRYFPAEKIGSGTFHYIQFTISTFLFLGVVVEALRTHFWRLLPQFNFVNTKSLAAAAIEFDEEDPKTRAASQGSAKLVAYYDNERRPRLRYAPVLAANPAMSSDSLARGLKRQSSSPELPLLDTKLRK